MRWVRRTGAAILVALLVVLIPSPGGDTPASAAALPNPVDPAGALTSTVVRMTQGSGGAWTVGDYLQAYTMLNRERGLATIPKAPAAPLTAPTAGAGFMAKAGAIGFTYVAGVSLGKGALQIYGTATGTDFDQVMCSGEGWLQGAYGLMTLGMGPSCKASFADPNAGLEAGWGGSAGGFTLDGYQRSSLDYQGAPYYSVKGSAAGGVTVWGIGSDGTYRSFGVISGSAQVGVVSPAAARVYYRSGGFRLCIGGSTAAACLAQGASAVLVPTELGADPQRDAVCTLTWADGSTTTGFVGQYRESEGFPIGVVDHACTEAFTSKPGAGPDLLPDRISIGSTNTETGAKTEIATQDVPHFSESEKVGLTPGDNTGLRLLKVVNGGVQSCMTWEASCVDWWTKTSSGTSGTTDEGTYRCEYGGREVALGECGIYRHTFDQQTDNPTITDPTTGQQTDWTSTADPANSYGNGAQSNQSNDRCVVSFSFNPVDWVLRPLRCAFEPRQSKIDQAKARMNAAWLGSGIGGLLVSLGGFVDTFNANQGCGGLPLHLEGFGVTLVDTRLLAACEEPAKGIAATVRSVLTVGILGGGLLASIRYLGAVFGFSAFGRINNGSNSGGSKVHFE